MGKPYKSRKPPPADGPPPLPEHRPQLVATFRNTELVKVAWEHRSRGCLSRRCYGRVDELPLEGWL